MAKEAGMIEAIQLWGRTCGRQGACDICPVGCIFVGQVENAT